MPSTIIKVSHLSCYSICDIITYLQSLNISIEDHYFDIIEINNMDQETKLLLKLKYPDIKLL